MPTWKKVVISGSAVSQLSNDANYLIAQQDGAILSGSFSGSFVGDGSNLSGIATSLVVSGSTGNDSLNLKTEALTISGDGQGITTSVDSGTNTISLVSNGLVSSSTQIQDLGFASDAELNASSSTLQSNIDGIDSRVTNLEAFSSSLDSAFATEAELYAATASLSSSAEAARVSLESSLTADLNASSSTLQGNIDSAITTANSELNASSSTLQGNIDSAISTANAELNASSSTLQNNIDGVESSLTVALDASSSTLQSNIDTKASITELNTSSSILQSNIDDVAANVAALGDTYATDAELNASSSTLQGNIDSAITTANSELNASSSTLQSNIDSAVSTANSELNASSSTLQSNIDGVETKADTAQAGVNGLNTYSASLKNAITVDGQNVTIAGDFTVSGTTTTVNSTTVEIDDNIIALNGTGATNAGLLVNDPDGPASGSFIWKGDQNAWFAGGEGSEVKVLLATGDDVVSGSQQIQDLGFASDAELNASSSTLQSNIDGVATAATSALNSSSSILQSNIDGVATTANSELNASSSTLQSNIDSAITTANTELNASSSTLQSNIDTVAASVSALGDTYATDAELDASSSILQGNIDSAITTANSELNASSSVLQGNIDTAISTANSELNASSSTLQSNIDTKADITELNASSSTLQSNIDGVDSRVTDLETFSSSLDASFASEAELNASSSTLQSNIDSAISTANSELNASSSTLQANIDSAITTANSELNTSSSTLQSNIDGVQSNLTSASSSIASDIASNDVDIAALQSFSSSVDTALAFDNTNLTVNGNLEVLGTGSFAYIQSITGSAKFIGDAYIVLNSDSDGERYSGLKVYDSGSLGETGSLEYDSVSNHWFYESTNEGYAAGFLAGPRSTRGNIAIIDKYSVLVGDGGNHITASALRDSGSAVTVAKNLGVTGDITVSGTVDGIDLQVFSASADSRLDSLESFSSSLDSSFTTEAELNASSSTLQGNIDSAITTANTELNASSSTLQGNIDTKADITALNASSSTLQGNIDSAITTANSELNASSSTLQGNIDTVDTKVGALETFSSSLDSIFATEAEMNATSASVKTYADNLVTNLSQTVAVSGSTGNDSIDLKTEALSIVGDGAGITTSVAANTVTITANGLVSASVEGDAQGQIKLNGSNVDINGLGSNDSPTFQDITINGNLTTLGTVTNVNTTDLNIEDKFVLLNSGSATGNSGLIVQNSATVGQGTALFFDDSASRWALDHSGADAIADTATADAYVAAVVTSDDPNYQKDGNIRVDSVTGEAYIFVS